MYGEGMYGEEAVAVQRKKGCLPRLSNFYLNLLNQLNLKITKSTSWIVLQTNVRTVRARTI